MATKLRSAIPKQKIADFCKRWNVAELALFGSILTDTFGNESDVDVLVEFAPGAHPTFKTLDEMEQELTVIFGRPVDLLTKKSIASSENYIRRNAILESAQVIYPE